MSHFTVLVIGNYVDEALAPFNECEDVDRYVEYTKQQLIDKSKKEIEDYKNGRYAEYLADPEKYTSECNPQQFQYITEEFPPRLSWTDDEHYADQIKWYEPEDIGPDGEVYSTSNPNGYWDWYQIGGRWAGALTVKPGTTFESPNFSWGWSEEEKRRAMESLSTDSAFIKDIDFDVMNGDNLKNYKERYALLQKWDELDMETRIGRFFWDTDQVEFVKSGKTLEEYLEEYMPHPLSAYAYIHEGEWHARWEMGWFAMSKNDMGKKTWNQLFREFIEGLDPETRVTFVDCHC